MRRRLCSTAVVLILVLMSSAAGAYTVGNPINATGSGKLAVSAGYEYHEIELPDALMTESTRYVVRASYGITRWLDVFAKAGTARLEIPLQEDRFVGDEKLAWGAGSRATLWRHTGWNLEVFSIAQLFSYRSGGRVDQQVTTAPETWTRQLNTKYIWWEYGGALGVNTRQGVVSPYAGVDVRYVEGERHLKQYNVFSYGTVYAGESRSEFSSEDLVINGFAGIDLILPMRYQMSVEVRGKGRDEVSFTIGLSQRSQ